MTSAATSTCSSWVVVPTCPRSSQRFRHWRQSSAASSTPSFGPKATFAGRSNGARLSWRPSARNQRSGSWETKMNSTAELASWLDHHREVVRRISRDPRDIERKLALAGRNLDRAARVLAAGDPDFALVAAESAMVNAADAVLSRQNVRVEKELAASLARRLGLAFDEGVVLGEGTNVLVHLRPVPVVARVTRLAHLVRPPESLAGGVALARALGERAVPPSALIDPGPHLEAGRYITLLDQHPGGPASALEAGGGAPLVP